MKENKGVNPIDVEISMEYHCLVVKNNNKKTGKGIKGT